MENGSAVVSFGDGCGYGLTDSEILEVGPVSPCAAGEGGSYRIDPYSGISRDPKVAATAYKQAQAFGGFGGG